MRVPTKYCALISFLILFLSHLTIPQTHITENKIQFKQLTHQEGFVARDIQCFYQDSKGFLWMCPTGILIRFDGKRQKMFRYSDTDNRSIGANRVRCIYEDKNKILWFGTDGGGLNRYNDSLENFTRYIHNPDDLNSISSNYIHTIFEDRHNNFWIGTLDGGLNKFNRVSGKFTSYKNNPLDIHSLSSDNVTVVYEDSEDNLWVGTSDGGLNLFDRENQIFTRYMHSETDPSSLSNNNVTGILEDKYGSLWISTMGGGLNKLFFDDQHRTAGFKHYLNDSKDLNSLSNNNIFTIYIDRENIFWIGTWGGGLNKMITHSGDNSSVAFISYKHDPLDIFSLSDDNVLSVYEDNSGILWVAAGGSGLQVYDKNKKQFRLYENEPNNPNSLNSTVIWSMYEDREGIRWIGTGDGGLNKMIRGTDNFIHYKNDPGDPKSLSDNCVSAIYEDKFDNLWVGTWNGGLNKFDRKSGRFYRFRHDSNNPKSISDDRIYALMGDSAGNLWIGTYSGGLNKFNRTDESFTHYRHNPDDSASISSDFMINLFSNINGDLFIATKTGLDTFDPKNKKFIHYNLSGNNSSLPKDIKVTSVLQSMSGILWIGTANNGLIKYNPKEGVKKIYTTNDGLPINYVTGILEDDHGNLWVSTTFGVSRFNPLVETIRTYIYEDGIQGIGEITPFKSRTGELIFGGVMGLSIFHPDSIRDYTHIPPVYFTDLYLFNKRVPIGYDSLTKRTILNKSMVECKEIVLNYDDNVLSFDFAIIDFHSIFKWNEFAYKMEGFDKDWIYANVSRTSNRSITYTNLNPGEYTLRVKAANSDNTWNEKGASLKIIILPPWWATTWAYIIYATIVLSLVYFTWKLQLKRVRNKHELKMSKFEAEKMHEVDEMKSRFFANISHEFRTPLTLILGPAKNVLGNTQEPNTKHNVSLIKRNAGRLLGLVNQLLDISKLESGNMKLETIPRNIVPLLKGCAFSFVSYAERKRIKLKFNSPEGEIIVYLDKDKFEKIIFNILSNAFKFTPEGGLVEVSVTKNVNYVDIKVSDTGVGIPVERIDKIFDRFYQVDGSHTREHEGTGIGLSLTKELVEFHKGKIEVESEPGKGSTFTVSLPLGKDHLRPEEICETDEEKEKEEYYAEGEEEKLKLEGIGTEFIEKDSLPLLLIVEDNSDVRTYIKENLNTDYRILEAVDGEDGWNKSVKHIPDLIVSDVMMPKIDGFKLCEKLKTDERTSHIPVILLTAKATKEDKLAGYETGADEYLMKPFDTDELKSRIKNLIHQRKRLQEHFRKQGLIGIDQQKITSVDKMFLQKSIDVINKHISDSSFSVEMFAEKLAISHSGLQKKIRSLIGETPGELIRRIRLNKAAELIKLKFGNISEIALEIGYNNPTHFSQAFKKQFGITPSQFQQNNNNS